MTIQQIILTGMMSLMLAACASGDPAVSALSQDVFVEVYVDLLKTSPADTMDAKSENAIRILNSHGVSAEEFRAAVDFYNENPERWKPILDEVVRRLEVEQAPSGSSPSTDVTSRTR